MCCSVSPGVSVRFSDTVLYAAEATADGRTVHVLGYQNKVQNRAGASGIWSALTAWVPGGAGNAMILPFPTVPRTMTRANVLDTENCRDVLQDMADAVAPPPPVRDGTRSTGAWKAAPPPKVQVFSAAGIYTVVLAQDPRDIPAALGQVPRAKRPALNPALFDAYARWYPDWTVALCCFNNRRARLAHPLLWWYEPMHPDRLFLPAVDGHTGGVPDLGADVELDHVLVVGSHRMRPGLGYRVTFGKPVPAAVAPYVRHEVVGRRFGEPLPNGDFECPLDAVRDGRYAFRRCRPPAAAAA